MLDSCCSAHSIRREAHYSFFTTLNGEYKKEEIFISYFIISLYHPLTVKVFT
jgi:hypothetical protein